MKETLISKNRDGSGNWPDRRHIGWTVATAGWVNLEYATRHPSDLPSAVLPPGFRMHLRGIEDGYGWFYHDRYGVLRLPIEVFIAWAN